MVGLYYEVAAKGNLAFKAGNYTDAIGHYTESINHTPTYTVYGSRSNTYYQLGKYSNALEDAKKAVALNRNWYRGYTYLGNAHSGLRQYDEAVSAFKKGLEVDPNNEDLKSKLAHVEVVMKAQAEFDAARSCGPHLNNTGSKKDAAAADNTKKDLFGSFLNSLSASATTLKQHLIPQVINDDEDVSSVKAALSVLKRMVDDGLIVKASDLWCVATDLFEDAVKREMFICMPDDEGRIAWLKHNITKQKKDHLIAVNVGAAAGAPATAENKEGRE
uniref:small glutamine-rich tetratricopeptide repeat-containing protein 2-like n=1 Tax=Erigeron canadensis TaxID=72917 RepID=UPI001CB93F50|nr:small glutamine-rich tetratricopeptide repeat-containing protein 2-like [Erigeron canadensis]